MNMPNGSGAGSALWALLGALFSLSIGGCEDRIASQPSWLDSLEPSARVTYCDSGKGCAAGKTCEFLECGRERRFFCLRRCGEEHRCGSDEVCGVITDTDGDPKELQP